MPVVIGCNVSDGKNRHRIPVMMVDNMHFSRQVSLGAVIISYNRER
jgi:hypothetical protein